MNERKVPRLRVQLTAITFSRLLINSAMRMTYPFLPALARGLGVSLAAVAQLVALRALAGFFSPFFSPLSERFGRRLVLVVTMLVFSLGCFIVVIWPAYWPLGATLIVTGAAKIVYDPVLQSYVGDVVAYDRRGKAIAVTEFAWAGSLLVGAPLVGFVMQRQGWQAPFFWLGLLGLLGGLLLWRLLPPGRVAATRAADVLAMLRVLRQHPEIWSVALFVFLAMLGNEVLFIVYGDWMETSFGLALTNLGLATGVIGVAEIVGELTAGWSVDRFGKRKVVLVVGLFTVVMYFLIPHTSVTLGAALATLFLVFLGFETTIVGSMPLMTEVVPTARSVVMSVALAAASLGRMLGAIIGPSIWRQAGLQGNTLTGAIVSLLALLVLLLWVREPGTSPVAAGSDP